MKEKSYRHFYTPEEVSEWANMNYGSFLSNTEAEIYQKVYEYTGSWYKPINSFLRRAPVISTPEFDSWWPDYENEARKEHEDCVRAGLCTSEFKFDEEDLIEWQSFDVQKKDDSKMINAFLHEHKLTEGIVTYRLVSKSYLKNLSSTGKITRDAVINDKAFLSTSLLLEGIDSIKKKYEHCHMKCAILKIMVPKGAFGAYVSQDGYMGNVLREYEFLLPPNTKLQVMKIHRMALPMVIECIAVTE